MFCFSNNIQLENKFFQHTFFMVTVLLFHLIGKGQIPQIKPKDIILLIGQSNMSGRAKIHKSDIGIIDNAFLLDSLNNWIPLKNPLNIHSSIRKKPSMQKFNLGYSFAQEIVSSKTVNPLGLIVNARGGTKINQWAPGEFYYQEAVRRSRLAMGNDARVIATFWLQGEGNLNDNDESYNYYFKKLKSIIYSLRKDLNNEKMIFIAGELNKNKPENKVFKKMLARLNTEVPYAASVKSSGTSTYDGTHYDNKSLKILGKRFAEKLKLLIE